MNKRLKTILLVFLSAILLFPTIARSEEIAQAGQRVNVDYLNDKMLALGVGIGGTVSPGLFAVKINADYIFDGIFSIGPYLQGSFGSSDKFFIAMLDGKFRTSIPEIRSEFKALGLIGLGLIYRDLGGIAFTNLTGHIGIGGEYFIMENISVGAEFTANITSTANERFFANFIVGVNYYL